MDRIVSKVICDLSRKSATPFLRISQNDSGTRDIEITLLNDGAPYILSGTDVASFAYSKMDGTSGWYDKLPDGSPAATVSGNKVTVHLAEQVSTCARNVKGNLVISDSNLRRVSTFPIDIYVEPSAVSGNAPSNNYYDVSTIGEIDAEIKKIWNTINSMSGPNDQKVTVYANPATLPMKKSMELIFYANRQATFSFGFGDGQVVRVPLSSGECGWYKFIRTGDNDGSMVSTKGTRQYLNPITYHEVTVSCPNAAYIVIVVG